MPAKFQIQFTPQAVEDLRWFPKSEQKEIVAGLELQLNYEPTLETRNRKRLRANLLAEWELRIGNFRIFYDVDQERHLIRVVAVGYKEGSQLLIRSEEYLL